MKSCVKLLRIPHYVKNLLIFAPLFFDRSIFNGEKLGFLAYMLVPFCLASSVIYIINDIHDAEKDRLHPRKKDRPIANGSVSKGKAKTLAIGLAVLVVVMVSVTALLGKFNGIAAALLALYAGLNLAYSRGLKNVPIVDIAILAAGYLIRLFYGAVLTDVSVSPWLYLTVMAGAFYLGMGKRRNEIRHVEPGITRKVLEKYNYEFLDKNMHVCLGLAITFYAMWAIQCGYGAMIWTVPLVLLILMKYSLDVEDDRDEGDPMGVIMGDRVLAALAGVYALAVGLIIYLG